LIRKPVLDAAGWFDERYFMYAEDVDLSRTVRALGWELYYDADCAIVHACGATSRKAPSGFSVLMKQRSVQPTDREVSGALCRTGGTNGPWDWPPASGLWV
jgi:GT2 family glycosyltransferase